MGYLLHENLSNYPLNLSKSSPFRESTRQLLTYLLGGLIEVDDLKVTRPPLWNRKGKQTILFISGKEDAIQALRERKDQRGGALHCPLTKAWLTFARKEEMLQRDLLNLNLTPQHSNMDHTETRADLTPKSTHQKTDGS